METDGALQEQHLGILAVLFHVQVTENVIGIEGQVVGTQLRSSIEDFVQLHPEESGRDEPVVRDTMGDISGGGSSGNIGRGDYTGCQAHEHTELIAQLHTRGRDVEVSGSAVREMDTAGRTFSREGGERDTSGGELLHVLGLGHKSTSSSGHGRKGILISSCIQGIGIGSLVTHVREVITYLQKIILFVWITAS